MAKIWEKHKGYIPALKYVNLTTRTCFRSIRIEGAERIPQEGAVILAPNHCAALMDPLLALVLFGGKPVVFGARSDIFANPKVAKVLRWLRILPIARERNGLTEVAKNFDTFKEIIDCLDHEVPFCLYPEGTHNPCMLLTKARKCCSCRLAATNLMACKKSTVSIRQGVLR